MSDESTKRFYDRISGAYDVLSDASEHRLRERGLEVLAVGEGESVLEIGFGTGHTIVELARSAGSTGRVEGVDLSEGMKRQTRLRLERELPVGVDRVGLRVERVPPLPWADATFHAVTLSFTLELFPDDEMRELLAEIRRVLRPEGRLGVVSMAVPGPGERESLVERTYVWMHRHFPHIVDCRPIEAEQVVEEAGFEVVATERDTIWTMPVAILVGRPG